jgi:hypothetical protein
MYITELTPEQKAKYVKAIEKIEMAPRPEKWRLTKQFILELKPWLVETEKEHCQACKELRQATDDKYAASKSGVMRNSMKIFGPVYNAMIKIDPELKIELNASNKNTTPLIGKQLWEAFPEYRIARNY